MEIIRLGSQIKSVAVQMGEYRLYGSGKNQIPVLAMRELHFLSDFCHVAGDNPLIRCEGASTLLILTSVVKIRWGRYMAECTNLNIARILLFKTFD